VRKVAVMSRRDYFFKSIRVQHLGFVDFVMLSLF